MDWGSRNPQSNVAGFRGVWNRNFYKASVATEIAQFNSRCRYNNAEVVQSRYYVTAATCTCPHHNRSEFMLAAPRLRARLITAMQKGIRLQCFTAKPVWKLIC
jgi:hypothetical protein